MLDRRRLATRVSLAGAAPSGPRGGTITGHRIRSVLCGAEGPAPSIRDSACGLTPSHPEYGAHALVTITGLILVLMVGLAVAFDAARYFRARAIVENVTREAALYAGTYLPNPVEAQRVATEFYTLRLRQYFDHIIPGVKTYFDSVRGDRVPYDGDASSETDGPTHKLSSADNSTVDLPVRSMTIRTFMEGFKPTFLGFVFSDENTPKFKIRAEATVALVPTDVMLVVENSNSLITPMAWEAGAQQPITRDDDFQEFFFPEWEKPSPGTHPDCNSIGDPYSAKETPVGSGKYGCATKALRYLRQCFGEGAYHLKRGAVSMYDLLSASGTYRVGVVHTMSASGEQAPVAVPLTTHPTRRYCTNELGADQKEIWNNRTNKNYHGWSAYPSANSAPLPGVSAPNDGTSCTGNAFKHINGWGIDVDPNAGAGNLGEDNYHPVNLEQAVGLVDHPSTRCAAVSQGVFHVPPHPLMQAMDLVDGALTHADYLNFRWDAGCTNIGQDCEPGGDQSTLAGGIPYSPPYTHLRFKSDGGPGALPGGGAVGYENPIDNDLSHLLPRERIWIQNSGYTNSIGLPIPRYDYSPAQLGIARAVDILNSAPPRGDGLPVRRRVVLVFADGADEFTDPFLWQQYATDPPYITLSNGTVIDAASAGALCADGNAGIATHTNVPVFPPADILNGFKLGVLYYGFSGPKAYPNDPLQKQLAFHNSVGSSEVADARIQCGTSWAMRRGRFWAEASQAAGGKPHDYWQKVVPTVARALFYPELM